MMDFVNRAIDDESIIELKANQPRYQHTGGALLKANKSYQGASENFPDLFCSFSPDLKFTFVNEAYCRYLNKKSDELIDKSILLLIKEEHHNEIDNLLSSLTRENPCFTIESPWISLNGKAHYQQWTGWAVYDRNGFLIEYQAIGREITARKGVEEEIRYRLRLEEAVARVSRILIDPGETGIGVILGILGEAVAVNRTYIFLFREDGVTCDNTYEWCDLETEPLINHLQGCNAYSYAWAIEKLLKGENIIIKDINDLPPKAFAEREGFLYRGIYSLLIVPINSVNGELRGCMGFEDTKQDRQWKDEDIRCLSMVAEMLGAYWERKQTEKSLRESEAKFRTLAEAAPALIYVWSESEGDGSLVFFNSGYKSIIGYSSEEVLGMSWRDLIHPDYQELMLERIKARLGGSSSNIRYEAKFLTKNGEERWGDLTASPIKWDGKIAVMGIVYDITERKHMEEELRQARNELEVRVKKRTAEISVINEKLKREIADHIELEKKLMLSEANFRKLAETSPALIFVFNEDRLLYMNSTAKLMASCSDEDMTSINPWELVHPDFRDVLRQAGIARRKGENVLPYEARLQGRNGQQFWGYLSADIIDYEGQEAILGAFIDISERKKMEEDLLQATKLESLGVLAGGIAHDFNNILTVISGNISLAKMIIGTENDLAEILNEVEKATFQARDLTQQLLTFSKGGAPIKETASIKELLMDLASFVLRGSNVSCKFAIPDDLWAVNIDKGQISQVVNNLIINADQAMPEGGTIELSAENITTPATALSLHEGEYVKISIKDQGIGIPEKYLAKVFDPYFTTKQEGHGLGLAMCYSIIKKHGGDIRIHSELGVGTTINIYLPASSEIAVIKKDLPKSNLFGQGKILIMDDEAIVRETLGRMLRHLGYNTVFAWDGQEAINLYLEALESGEPYDALIMDLTVAGGMGGKEAVQKLLQFDSQAKVLVSSGYSNDPVMADYEKYGFCGVIPKPYDITKVNQVLYEAIINNQDTRNG